MRIAMIFGLLASFVLLSPAPAWSQGALSRDSGTTVKKKKKKKADEKVDKKEAGKKEAAKKKADKKAAKKKATRKAEDKARADKKAERAAKKKAARKAKKKARADKKAERAAKKKAERAAKRAERARRKAEKDAAQKAEKDAAKAASTGPGEPPPGADEKPPPIEVKAAVPGPGAGANGGAPAPPAKSGKKLVVLLIPLTGEQPGPGAQQPLTDTLKRVLSAKADRPVEIRDGTPDTIAIAGCQKESPECFDSVADILTVQWMVWGKVQGPAADGSVTVAMTKVDAEQRTYTSRNVVLKSGDSNRAAEFEVKSSAFIAGEPEPEFGPVEPEPELPEPELTDVQDDTKPVTPGGGRKLDLGNVETYSWGVAGGGVAVAATGFVLLAVASGKKTDLANAPAETFEDLENLAAIQASGEAYTNWGNGLAVVGGIAAAVGIGLIVKQGYLDSREKPSVELTLTPSADQAPGVTLTLGGRF